jgi:hypothetical protein
MRGVGSAFTNLYSKSPLIWKFLGNISLQLFWAHLISWLNVDGQMIS